MQIPDVNVLVYAFVPDFPQHERARSWLEHVLNQPDDEVVFLDVVLLGFLRISTSARLFEAPRPMTEAVAFVDVMFRSPAARRAWTSADHWQTFQSLAVHDDAGGGGLTDAYIAALGIALDSEVVTFDRGFARFPGLRWTEPPEL